MKALRLIGVIFLGWCVLLLAMMIGGLLIKAAIGAPIPSSSLPVPHSRWLAQCSAIPVSAVDGITVERVTVRQGRLSALLRAGNARGWLQAHRLGTLSGAGVWAVRGPTALRDRMAMAPECSEPNGRVLTWPQASALPSQVIGTLADGLTCCGLSKLDGRLFRAWPCTWSHGAVPGPKPSLELVRLDGVGPGVVGARGPCADYEVE